MIEIKYNCDIHNNELININTRTQVIVQVQQSGFGTTQPHMTPHDHPLFFLVVVVVVGYLSLVVAMATQCDYTVCYLAVLVHDCRNYATICYKNC